MAHGAPDYSNVVKERFIHRLDDLAEHAVRLGSLHSYDRLGDILIAYDLRYGNTCLSIGGDAPIPDWGLGADFSINGGYTLNLRGPADPTEYIEAYNLVFFNAVSIFGFEIAVAFPTLPGIHELWLFIWTGSQLLEAAMRYKSEENKWYYYDTTGSWTELPEVVATGTAYGAYHHMKLVVDAVNALYVRQMLDGNTHAFTDIGVKTSASTIAPQLKTLVRIYRRTATTSRSEIDYFIVTQNEPL